MTIYYVDNQNAQSTSPFSSWAQAARFVSSIAQIDAAGDTIYVAARHAETTATATTWTWGGTSTSPTRLICADHTSGNPPTTISTGASCSTTGAANMIVCAGASSFYCYGINFSCGTASTAADLTLLANAGDAYYERCRLSCNAQAIGTDLIVTANQDGNVVLKDCELIVKHNNTAFQNPGSLSIIGGRTISTTPNPLLESIGIGAKFFISGFDCSSLVNTMNFINNSVTHQTVNIRNCKLPDSWSGTINSAAVITVGGNYSLMNSDNADTNYRLLMNKQFGTIVHETTIVKTGGATDGVTPISWEVSTCANTEWNHQFVDSPEIVRWVTTVGSPVSVGVDIVHDSTTPMTTRDIWLDVQYLGTNGFPLSLFANSATTYAAVSTAYAASGATWDTTGMTDPNKQLISTSFTPQEVGFIHGTIRVTQASKVVYIDPVLQIL